MSGEPTNFDPYHKWLAIPPGQRPLTHYLLLGLTPLESDLEVIQAVARQRIEFVRGFLSGPHADQAQTIFLQLSAARACLLDPYSKQAYDALLQVIEQQQRQLEAGQTASADDQAPAAWSESLDLSPGLHNGAGEDFSAVHQGDQAVERGAARDRSDSRQRRKRVLTVTLAGHILAPLLGLTLGYLVLCSFGPQYDFLKLVHGGEQRAAKRDPKSAQPLLDRSEQRPRREPTARSEPSRLPRAGDFPVSEPPQASAEPKDQPAGNLPSANTEPQPAAPAPQLQPPEPALDTDAPDPPAAEEPARRLPPPDAEAQAVVAVDLADKSAERLLEEAARSTHSVRTFILLDAARLRAGQSGDSESAFRALDELERRYEIDLLAVKLETLEALCDVVAGAEALSTTARAALELVEIAAILEDRKAAARSARLALAAAQKAGNEELEATAARVVAQFSE